MPPRRAIDVFLSSTCHDLADLRAELRRHLEENAFSVRLSDDYDSAFAVDPNQDSIQSCLLNVTKADVVVCVIDRRYGPPLPHGEYQGKSATHAEILFARKPDVNKPVCFFIRDRALQEHDQLRSGRDYTPRYVEKQHLKDWVEFVSSVRTLPEDGSRSNWIDQFATSVDLKSKVTKRLLDWFPEHMGILALRPDRLVRLFFESPAERIQGAQLIRGHFKNAGVGPALNLKVGVWFAQQPSDVVLPLTQGGLAEGEAFPDPAFRSHLFSVEPDQVALVQGVYCDYENRYRDRYRVVVPFRRGPTSPDEDERFLVGQKEGERLSWIPVE